MNCELFMRYLRYISALGMIVSVEPSGGTDAKMESRW